MGDLTIKDKIDSISDDMYHENVKAIMGRYYNACITQYVSPEDHDKFLAEILSEIKNIRGDE